MNRKAVIDDIVTFLIEAWGDDDYDYYITFENALNVIAHYCAFRDIELDTADATTRFRAYHDFFQSE